MRVTRINGFLKFSFREIFSNLREGPFENWQLNVTDVECFEAGELRFCVEGGYLRMRIDRDIEVGREIIFYD